MARPRPVPPYLLAVDEEANLEVDLMARYAARLLERG